MTTISVNLPDDLGQYIANQAETEGYSDPGAYILSLLETNRSVQERVEMEEKLLDGVKARDRGEGRPMMKADWDRMRDRARGLGNP